MFSCKCLQITVIDTFNICVLVVLKYKITITKLWPNKRIMYETKCICVILFITTRLELHFPKDFVVEMPLKYISQEIV